MKNRTCTIHFHRDIDKELESLRKGGFEPGHVSYTFGTVQAAAKWLATAAGKREVRKAKEVLWGIGDGGAGFIRNGIYQVWCEQGREALVADAADVAADANEKAFDDEYLSHWKSLA